MKDIMCRICTRSLTVLHAAVIVGATVVGIAGCDGGGTEGAGGEGEGEGEGTTATLGSIGVALSLGDAVDPQLGFDTLTVTLSGLGACDDREVALRAVTPDFDDVLVGGPLPARVPPTGADHTIAFTSTEVLTARGAAGTSGIEAVLRCAAVEVDRQVVSVRDAAAVAGVSGSMPSSGERIDDVLVLDDGGVLMMSSTIDADDDTLVHVFLDAFDSAGARRAASRELGILDAVYYGSSQVTFPKDGPGIDRVGNDAYAVRLYDDPFRPLFAWTAIVDSSGAIVREWADRAAIQVDVVGNRIVLLRTPLVTARTDGLGVTVIDIIDAATGADIVTGIETGLEAGVLIDEQSRATLVAVSDTGVDVTIGNRTNAAVLLARDGAAPVIVSFPRPNNELVTLAPLPGANNGSLVAAIGNEQQTTFKIVALNAAQDGFDTETLLTVDGQVFLGGVVRSRTQQALAILMTGDASGFAHYVYFHGGELVCSMKTAVLGDTRPTVTDDELLIVGGGTVVTTCDDERRIDGGVGNPTETNGGFVALLQNLQNTSISVIQWLSLETLVEFSTPASGE